MSEKSESLIHGEGGQNGHISKDQYIQDFLRNVTFYRLKDYEAVMCSSTYRNASFDARLLLAKVS